ncbi:papain-like cysteine peptidase [Acetobacteraceae bacterium KSS8]|uniref:Papain-like cysteine peptidase n=1 Tax=Endosaccharibacter trunci TaxID=2812733 RepID=A0ABT1W1W0_9PROT|nr:papain-like cysteine peptidase [Acetobacteraceae bacterium KSS8]
MALSGPGAADAEPFRHVVGLGSGCWTAQLLKDLDLRRAGGPFDWIFSSPRMVQHCLRDDFATFLDERAYGRVGSPQQWTHPVFRDAYGLGVVVNHHDLAQPGGFGPFRRAVDRLRTVLAGDARTLFVAITPLKPDWSADNDAIVALLRERTRRFRFLSIALDEPAPGGLVLERRRCTIDLDEVVLRPEGIMRDGLRFERATDNEALRSTMQDYRFELSPPPMALLSAAVDRPRLLSEAAALEGTFRWLDAQQGLDAVSAAIARASPFSLLLLDPVAGFAAAIDPGVRRVLDPAQRQALLDESWRIWFDGQAPDTDDPVLRALGEAFSSAVQEADILCIPAAAELAGDPARFGALARLHASVRTRTDALFGPPSLLPAMHETLPYLRTLLAGLPFLGFVGAHPAMFRKLSHFCGVHDARFVPVPREAAFPVAEDGIDPRGFMPDGHRATLDALSVPYPGAVFLVSAPGPLGAVYAGRIKSQGGIAIEIGSLAARWAGG